MKVLFVSVLLLSSFYFFESKLILNQLYTNYQFLHLKQLPPSLFRSKMVCIWTDSNIPQEKALVLKYLFFQYYNQSYMIINYNSVNINAKTCVNNVLFNKDFTNASVFFKDRPPTIENFFLIIDFSNTIISPANSSYENYFKIFGISKAILIQRNQMFMLSSPYFPPRKFLLVMKLVSSMLEERTIVNLRRRNVTIATFNCSLFSIMKSTSSTHDGIEMRMLNELAHKLNFTPVFIDVKGVGKWGKMLPNGSWVGGVIGALESGEAELGFCNIWNVFNYVNSFDFGPQWNAVYYTYMVPRPRMVHGFWIIIMQLFKWSVWLLLLSTFALVTFLYWKFKIPQQNIPRGLPDGVESVLTIYGIFIATSSHLPSSTVRFARQVVTCWSVFSFFICVILCNTIISRLMIPHLSSLIDSVEDIVQHELFWGEPGYTNDSKRAIYFNLYDPWQRQLESRYGHLTMNTSRAALHSGKFVFPVQRLSEDYIFINIDGLKTADLKGFRVISQNLNQFYVSFGFSKHSPLLKVCHKPLRTFIESGLVHHWRKHVILQYGKGLVKSMLFEPTTEGLDSFKPLTLGNSLAAFRMLFSGLVLATVSFFCELLFKYRHLHYMTTKQNEIV